MKKALYLVMFIININTQFEIISVDNGEGYMKFHTETTRHIE
jgi:hypothetical protein